MTIIILERCIYFSVAIIRLKIKLNLRKLYDQYYITYLIRINYLIRVLKSGIKRTRTITNRIVA